MGHAGKLTAMLLAAIATILTSAMGHDVAVYPPTPHAMIDERLAAFVAGQAQGHSLEVQNAPTRPLTRDPGYGRPPLPSSRLRLAAVGQLLLPSAPRPPLSACL